MNTPIKKVVVLGGGTAGWISAALLNKLIGPNIRIELVESDHIGTVGVGEATIPPIKHLNSALEINEAEFLKETKATIKLAIKFENWGGQNESYYHTFGSSGKGMAFCQFHHLLKRTGMLEDARHIWQYDLNYLCAEAGKFAPIKSKDPILDIPYAYHFDATLYAQFLRKISVKRGVIRTEGKVEKVHQCQQTGNITALQLENGRRVDGDLFIDCSGFKGLLTQQTLRTGYEDWSHWLQCDRAIAVPSKRLENTLPYTRSIAHSAGWQWRIPLQHRNGNGIVYSSQHYSDEQAADILLNNLDSEATADPNFIQFQTGRRYQQWNKNVIAVGLSSGFLEPLESTSIHLIQSAIVRLVNMFPNHGINPSVVKTYNQQSKVEFEQIRDFIILHYHLNKRTDSAFWRDMQQMNIPQSLTDKINLFSESGLLFREQNDLFSEWSWLQVFIGQGIIPKDHHPIANNMSIEQLKQTFNKISDIKKSPINQLPSHDEFLESVCRSS